MKNIKKYITPETSMQIIVFDSYILAGSTEHDFGQDEGGEGGYTGELSRQNSSELWDEEE